jgi:hypothetical protein
MLRPPALQRERQFQVEQAHEFELRAEMIGRIGRGVRQHEAERQIESTNRSYSPAALIWQAGVAQGIEAA